jgi:O-antigen/teichoic acid export membrane protein
VLGDVAGFAGSQYFLRFAQLLKGFLVARVLGPAGNGLWQHFVLITEYCEYSHLGALQGLNKVLGHRIGRGDRPGSDATQRAGVGFTMASSAVLFLALAAYVAIRWDRLAPYDRWGLPLVGAVVVAKQLAFVYHTVLRAYSRIGLISVAETVFGVANLALSIALLFVWGVAGLLIAWIATRLATALWMIRSSGLGIGASLARGELGVLLATGLPIYLFQLTRVGLRNVDRVLVDSVLDNAQLGIYGLAVTLAGLVRYAADAVGFVLYPLFLRSYGETGDARAGWERLAKPTELLALLVAVSLGFSWLVLHLPILWLLPEFVASIEIYRLLTLTVAFQCLAVLPGFYLMAIDRQNLLVPLGVGAIAFDLLAGRWMIAEGHGLPGVAVAMGIGSALYSAAVLAYAAGLGLASGRARLAWLVRVHVPIVLGAALVAVVGWAVPRSPLGAASEYVRAGVEGLLFLALTVPLLVSFERRHRVLGRLRRGRGGAGGR